MKKFYHATKMSNFYNILEKGILVGVDGIVYLAETAQEAYRFMAIRNFGEPILVIEVELDENAVQETFDHSYQFFQCRAFGYPDRIPLDKMTDFLKFERK